MYRIPATKPLAISLQRLSPSDYAPVAGRARRRNTSRESSPLSDSESSPNPTFSSPPKHTYAERLANTTALPCTPSKSSPIRTKAETLTKNSSILPTIVDNTAIDLDHELLSPNVQSYIENFPALPFGTQPLNSGSRTFPQSSSPPQDNSNSSYSSFFKHSPTSSAMEASSNKTSFSPIFKPSGHSKLTPERSNSNSPITMSAPPCYPVDAFSDGDSRCSQQSLTTSSAPPVFSHLLGPGTVTTTTSSKSHAGPSSCSSDHPSATTPTSTRVSFSNLWNSIPQEINAFIHVRRIESTLHFRFPVTNTFLCTETKCKKFFSSIKWSAMSFSLKKHLTDDHDIIIDNTTYWCSICSSKISGCSRIKNHRCFKDRPTLVKVASHRSKQMTLPTIIEPSLSPSSCAESSPLSMPILPSSCFDSTPSSMPNLPSPCRGSFPLSMPILPSSESIAHDFPSPGKRLSDSNPNKFYEQSTSSPIIETSSQDQSCCSDALLTKSQSSSTNDHPSHENSSNSPTLSIHFNESPLRDISPVCTSPIPGTSTSSHSFCPSSRRRKVTFNSCDTASSREDQSSTSNEETFPGFTCRRGNNIHFVFPIYSTLRCTEENCRSTFVNKNWSSSKQSLLRHLLEYHDIKNPTVFRWCSFCQISIPVKISSHTCLSRISFFNAPRIEQEKYKFSCDRCSFSCPSKSGIRNHLRSHSMNDIKARRSKIHSASGSQQQNKSPNTHHDQSQISHSSNAYVETSDSQASPPDEDLLPDTPVVPIDSFADANDADEFILQHPDEPSPSDPFTARFRQLLRPESIDTWQAFSDILEEFITFSQAFVKLPPPRNFAGPARTPNIKDPRIVQKLYKRNRRRALRLITGSDSKQCSLPVDVISEHFNPTVALSPPHDVFTHPTPAPEPPDQQQFTPEEIMLRLRSAENSAPGPDRLTYQHWRNVDPDGRALSTIFNICLKCGKVPDSWKESRTILLPKGGSGDAASDWRPIALSSTISKLFTGCLAKRISSWVEENQLLSPCQKGFLPFDGALENNYVLSQRLQNARINREDLCIMSLDISNAFGSVPHSALFDALDSAGIGEKYLNIIKDFYFGTTTCYLTESGISNPISVTAGVRQGCPLSGLLFNFVIDPILREVQPPDEEYRVLAFADDIMLLSSSPDNLQTSIDKVFNIANLIGFTLNPSKCFSMHLGSHPIGCRDTTFTINGTSVPNLLDGDPGHFLGKPVGYRLVGNSNDMSSFHQAAKEIMTSYLAPWQRLDALRTFFFPTLNYAQRTAQFSKTDWKEIDDLIKPLLKKTISVPSYASNGYLYGNQEHGLLGIPLAAEDSDIALVDTAFKLLSSKDACTKSLAWSDLKNVVQLRIQRDPSSDDLADFLSGVHLPGTTNPISTTWSKARSASSRLKILWSCHDDWSISISLGEVTVTDRRKIFKSLRTYFKNIRSDQLKGRPHQGKTFTSYSMCRSSSHFFRNGEFTRFVDWRFIHNARLGTIKLNGNRPGATDEEKKCRRCGFENESLPHVLNHCLPLMAQRTKRHNKIVKRVKNCVRGEWKLYKENQPIGSERLRPDLVFTNGDDALILDVTVPFENGRDAFRRARQIKEDKYANLAQELRNRFKKVDVQAIIVGSLGSWDPRNDRTLLRLCSKKYLKLMKKLIVSDTIKWSRDIFFEHVTGTRPNPGAQNSRAHRPISDIRDLVSTARQTQSLNSTIDQQTVNPSESSASNNIDLSPRILSPTVDVEQRNNRNESPIRLTPTNNESFRPPTLCSDITSECAFSKSVVYDRDINPEPLEATSCIET